MDDDKTPMAYKIRLRMGELLHKAMDDGTIDEEDWDLYVLGFTVLGGDPLLQQAPLLAAYIICYELGGLGVTEGDLVTIIQGMKTRRYHDEFNRD